MATTATRPTVRARIKSATQWFDSYSLWALNPSPTSTPRDARPTTPRTRHADEEQPAPASRTPRPARSGRRDTAWNLNGIGHLSGTGR